MDANNNSAAVEAVSTVAIMRMAIRQIVRSGIFIIESSLPLPFHILCICFHLIILLYYFCRVLRAITFDFLGVKCHMHSVISIFLFAFCLKLIESEIVSVSHRIAILLYLSLQVVLSIVRLLFNVGVLAILKLFSRLGINIWCNHTIHEKNISVLVTQKIHHNCV